MVACLELPGPHRRAGLRRARIDLLHRTIRVEESGVELRDGSTIFGDPKTAAGRRTVAFPAEPVPMIETHLAKHVSAKSDSLVFTSRDGLPLRRTKFRPYWAEACKEARKISGLHFHAPAWQRSYLGRYGRRHL